MTRTLPALLVLLACGGDEKAEDTSSTTTSTTGDVCGVGPATVQLGGGGPAAFDPFEDGEMVALTEGPDGGWGVRIEMLTVGLNTTKSVTVVVDLTVEGGSTETLIGQLSLQCQESGHGWTSAFAALHDDYQTNPDALSGQNGTIEAVVTDSRGETASHRVTMELFP
jgi:hypothetical protein